MRYAENTRKRKAYDDRALSVLRTSNQMFLERIKLHLYCRSLVQILLGTRFLQCGLVTIWSWMHASHKQHNSPRATNLIYLFSCFGVVIIFPDIITKHGLADYLSSARLLYKRVLRFFKLENLITPNITNHLNQVTKWFIVVSQVKLAQNADFGEPRQVSEFLWNQSSHWPV